MASQDARAASRPLLVQASPLMLARLASSALSFFLPIYLSRRLAVPEFGTYKQFFLVALTLLNVLQLGLSQSLYYFVPKDRPRAGAYVAQALALLCGLGALTALGVGAASSLLARSLANPALAALGVPLGLFTGLSIASIPLEVVLTATGQVGAAAVSYILSDGIRTVLLIGIVILGRGLPGIAWAAVAYGVLRAGAVVVLVARGRMPVERPRLATLRAHLGYALPFAAAGFVVIGAQYFPQYAVAATTDASTFALFAVGTLQLPITDLLYTPVSEVMMVRLSQGGGAGALEIFHEATARLATFFFGLAAVSWALASVLIPALFTYKYVAAVPIWSVVVAEMPLVALPLDGMLRSFAATRTLLAVNLGRCALVVPLTLLGLRGFGLIGAAAGFMCTQLVTRLAMLWRVKRMLRVGTAQLLPWRALGRTAVRAAAAAVPAALVARATPLAPKYALLAGSAAFAVPYLALLWAAGEIHEALGLPRAAGSRNATG